MGRRRKLVWATTSNTVAVGAGQTQNWGLLAAYVADGGSHQGVTVMRSHIRLTPTTAPALNSTMEVGLIVGRSTDVGLAVAGAVTPGATDLDWMYLDTVVANPTFGEYNTNILRIDNRSKRKIEELQQTLVLSVFSGAALSWTVWSRVLLALP